MSSIPFDVQFPELAAQGYFAPVTDFTPTYVLMAVADPEFSMAVGLMKNKGPEHLIGKVTFPGGKIEPGESITRAATREMQEEAGIEIEERAWIHVASSPHLALLMATNDKVLSAHTCESEPVFPMSVVRQLEYCIRSPERYAPDFHAVLITLQRLFHPAK